MKSKFGIEKYEKKKKINFFCILCTYFRNIVEYWHLICSDGDLTGILLENFLQILSSSCLFEPNEPCVDRQKIASVQPFAIFCALNEMMACKDINEVNLNLFINKLYLHILMLQFIIIFSTAT